MLKPEMSHLSEMSVNACQMNVHSWDAGENTQNRHSREQKRCVRELKSICNSLLQCVCIKKERERKQQLKPSFYESIAEKDIDSVKDQKVCVPI